MYYPDFSRFKELAREYNRVPIYREFTFLADPQEAFRRLKTEGSHNVLLESGGVNSRTGRWSFLAKDPEEVFQAKGKANDPIGKLRALLKKYHSPRFLNLPDFTGGAIGYISYDACHYFEKLPRTAVDDINIPDIYFAFYNDVICFDHELNKTYVISNASKDYEKAISKIDQLSKVLVPYHEKTAPLVRPDRISKAKNRDKELDEKLSNRQYKSSFGKEEFAQVVLRAKEYITAGDIFQANLSQRLEIDTQADGFHLYQVLSELNPSNFAAYLEFDDVKLVSSSPERLIRLDGQTIETRPIAGTRPRGKTANEDARLSQELILSEKERAEHIMLVDLERNDLGRVASYGTVYVNELMVQEEYSRVRHIVSNITARLARNKDRLDLIRAVFPGGTITGCPKVRCMEIIDELEPVARNIYTGAIGYLGYNGNMDLNIVIRTFLLKNNKAYLQVGAGIVADSEPTREYYETLYKAQALIEALEIVENNVKTRLSSI